MYRLNVARILEAAKKRGDKTPYAVAKRTGISVSSAYRILTEKTQPDLNSALRLTEAYDLDIHAVVDRVDDEDEEPAEAAA